ncbi:hypothetical protein ACJ41P_10725 [Azospirillum argentinense]|uniref:Uncharacterized protein n=1 Tax=Azospirillum argentinense TaxID=2970906 RepID=A0ABW8V8Q2_9PROT
MPDADDTMTLDEFIAEEKARLDAFAKHWREQQIVMDEDIFPSELPPGEWDEQYRSFGAA